MTETSTWSSLLGHPKVHSGQPDDRWMVTYPRGLLGVTVTNLATLAVNGTVEGIGRPALGPIAFASVPERSSAFVGAS